MLFRVRKNFSFHLAAIDNCGPVKRLTIREKFVRTSNELKILEVCLTFSCCRKFLKRAEESACVDVLKRERVEIMCVKIREGLLSVCVCVCVCEREKCVCAYLCVSRKCVSVCVCVCVREREREIACVIEREWLYS